jgi:hypothetical protein
LPFRRLFTICKNMKPPKIIKQIINKLEIANSLMIRLTPGFLFV